MGSSGNSGNPSSLVAGGGTPMPGLPVAGKDNAIGDPFEYGKFQNFLPELASDGGANPMATGLTPDMLQYKSPGGGAGGMPGGPGNQIQELRDALAKIQTGAKPPGLSGAASDIDYSSFMSNLPTGGG